MKPKASSLPLICALALACSSGPVALSAAHAQDAATKSRAVSLNAEHALLAQMVGTWEVAQRIWTSANTRPIEPPPAIARRRLVGDVFLEEVMEAAPGSGQEPFTRIAWFNYNKVTRRFETISMDTRAPQMMYEKSYEDDRSKAKDDRRTIKLSLDDNFVLPQWGDRVNAAFKGRKVIEIEKDRQTVRLYWTPLAGESGEEFLAGEYVFTRKR
ncbi:MAG: DUF1579 family protein [Steroidobacter sp.]